MSKSMTAIAEAIAAEFEDEITRQNRDGEEYTFNRLGFMQRNVLSQLARAMHYAEDYQSERTSEARDKAKAMLRQGDGTEIGLKQLEDAVGSLETYELGLAAVSALKAALVEKHDAVAPEGRKWKVPAPRASAKPADADERRKALAARLGVDVSVITGRQTNGTRGDESESAATDKRGRTKMAKDHDAA